MHFIADTDTDTMVVGIQMVIDAETAVLSNLEGAAWQMKIISDINYIIYIS